MAYYYLISLWRAAMPLMVAITYPSGATEAIPGRAAAMVEVEEVQRPPWPITAIRGFHGRRAIFYLGTRNGTFSF